jgi:hypothetical protein
MSNQLAYPIGQYEPQLFSEHQRDAYIRDIAFLPQDLEIAVQGMNARQLATPYRPGGWTVNQVVHHVADSHMNAYIRFKLALTENNPVIKPYDEKAWATLPDNEVVVNYSLTLLHALHKRWVALLKSLPDADWNRTIFHPGKQQEMTLWHLLGLYAWHGRHHVAHVQLVTS